MCISRTRSRVFFAVTAALLLGAIEVSAVVPAVASASRPQSAGALGDGSAPSLHLDVVLRSDDVNGDMVTKFRDAVAFSVGAATPDDAAVSVTFPVVGVLAFDEADDTKVDLAAVAATVATSLGTPLGTVSTRIFPVDGRLAQMVAAMGAAAALGDGAGAGAETASENAATAGWCRVAKSGPACAPPVRLSSSSASFFAATSCCFSCSLSLRRFSRRCWLP